MRLSEPHAAEAVVEFDRMHLISCTDGDVALADLLFGEFLDHLASYVAELLGTATTDAWRDGAHRIKGAARGIGARALAETAALVEDHPPVTDIEKAQAIRALRAHEQRLRQIPRL